MGLFINKLPTDIETVTSWGCKYRLLRSRRKTLGLEIKDGHLIVRAPLRCSNDEVNGFLDAHRKWVEKHLVKTQVNSRRADIEGALAPDDIKKLAAEAKKVIPERVKFYAEMIGVTYGRITIRNQTSRWGSCSSKGNLNFNCLLMLTPLEVLDSVIVHELCHRKEMNHSDRFYREVLRVYPDYYKYHKWLKNNGEVLIRRMKAGIS